MGCRPPPWEDPPRGERRDRLTVAGGGLLRGALENRAPIKPSGGRRAAQEDGRPTARHPRAWFTISSTSVSA